jgi:glycosyltransferase involved in cell wall biosynthesis
MHDILFLARNRLAYTRASVETLLRNTNWHLVRKIWIYDDGSTDGTREYLEAAKFPVETNRVTGFRFGGPVAVMRNFLTNPNVPEIFTKIDNDVLVPPQWLDMCMAVIATHGELDLLGIEPPESRTPHYPGGMRSAVPEYTGPYVGGRVGYAPCTSIGGIGMMRTATVRRHADLQGHSVYGGFTEWQIRHAEVCKGWIVPPIDVVLLDRLPVEPWQTLSREYVINGWQRSWTSYATDNPYWRWFTEGVGVRHA